MIEQTTILSSQESKKLKNKKTVATITRYINCVDIKGKKLKEPLLPEQKEVLWNYYNGLRAGDGAKMNSLLSVLSYLRPVIRFGKYIKKPYNKVVKQDIINWVSYLQHEADEKNKSMSLTTMTYYRFLIKLFYRWLFQTGKDYPKVVAWIPEKTASRRILDDTTLLSNSEIKQMVKHCDNDRDKSIIMILYEGALRIGELTEIRLNDIIIKPDYCEIKVDGKTGQRLLPLIDSKPYLSKWLNNHPFKQDKESFLFISFSLNKYGTEIKRTGVRGILRKSAKRGGITKRVFPHLLRHSRLTHMAQQGFNERDLRLYAGWKEGSKAPSTYLHYGYDHLRDKLLEKKNRLSDEEKARKIREQRANEPKICARCGEENTSDALYCVKNNCGAPLDLRTVQKELRKREQGDEILNKIVNHPELSKEFMKLLKKAKDM